MNIEFFIDENHSQINDNIVYLHISNVNSIEDATCLSIELNNCLDYVLKRQEMLRTVVQKLRIDGVLSLNGIDLDSIAYNYNSGTLNLSQTQQLLYAGRTSIDTLGNMAAQTSAYGLKTIKQTLDNNQYFLKAQRMVKG